MYNALSSASLDNTTAWLQAAALEEMSAISDQSESPSPDIRGPVSATAVLNRAYIYLLHWDPQDQKYPEVSCSQQIYLTQHSCFHLRDNLLPSVSLCFSLLTLLHVKTCDSMYIAIQPGQMSSSNLSFKLPITIQMCPEMNVKCEHMSVLVHTVNYIVLGFNNVCVIAYILSGLLLALKCNSVDIGVD